MKIFKQLKKLLNHPLNKKQKIYTLGKILWWKFNQLFFNIPAIERMTPRAKLVCYPNSSYGSFVMYAKFPEYNEMKFIQSVVSDGDVIIDVGANIGAISVLTASKGKDIRVFAFEPTKELLPLIQENISINRFEKRIKVFEMAVSNKVGKLKFALEDESETNHILNKNSKNKNFVAVKSTTLDYFTKQKKIKEINFLKIDVEGAEFLVIQGAKELLKNKMIDIILFELNIHHNEYDFKPSDIINLFKENGYFVFFFDNKGLLKLVSNHLKIDKTINLVAVKKSPNIVKKILKFI